ncbi:cysteine-rich receptor-like protein kinase 44 isoform X2 [Argentina anserina]|uniref:cysteine-rich receptor-like protein kinase 44 isoform X2 n=1 Tax=Argentina anserina TaxID=57926 RepID=UPI00217622A9|nr:cysteine-rich receptor-like protein kinase 44 isoform X2 [Potentilla anserina]
MAPGLSFTFLLIHLSSSFFRSSTAAAAGSFLVYKNGSFEIGSFSSQDTVSHKSLLASTPQGDICDSEGRCGPNGLCAISDSPVCSCLKGYKPKEEENWSFGKNSDGCVRVTPLMCPKKDDGFVKYDGVKVPASTNSRVNRSMSLDECKEKCFNNCSCMAYASSDVNVCIIWFGDLLNIRKLANGGENLYVRMPASELNNEGTDHRSKFKVIIATVASGVCLVLVLLAFYCIRRKGRKQKEMGIMGQKNDEQNEDLELPLYSLSTIMNATDSFSSNKKLGEGGFGPVYKGILKDGQEIAVKRLSQTSGQGAAEFKNEVILIAKLQHRNLVKLLGCCIEGEEKLLVYEYMSNRSLDFYIFDQTQDRLLDWSQRFQIFEGVARGLLYLHQDSRLRIIHRDLKASNVLLDDEMKPKISDFGMARLFGGDETEGVTNRIVGTYGYMAPEYAIDGQFSVKSDVFSFGILLLETVTGKRSRGFHNPKDNLNLVGHVWRMWKEGRSLEAIDECLRESCNLSEALHCIHIGLLCAQELPEDRPMMASVILMLGGETALPQPKRPGLYVGKYSSSEADSSSSKNQTFSSTNECSITIEAR